MSKGRFTFLLFVVLAAGTMTQAWLGSRAGIGGDQYVLLDLGLDYVETGELKPFGKGMSGGGFIPGSLLQLLIGVPFSLWHDYRSPAVLTGLFHLGAAVLAAVTVGAAAGGRAALLFTLIWWLSPWRLFHSAILWEPSYVFLPAAAHLWACWQLRERGAIPASAVLAATMVLTFQLHGSFLYLVVLTALLAAFARIRVRWEGFLAGALLGALTLLPTAAAFMKGTLPTPAPTESFLFYGLVTVVPVLRGAAYWFRLGSLDVGRRLTDVVFLDPSRGDGQTLHLALQGATTVLVVCGLLSILLAMAASWWFFRRKRVGEGRPESWLWLRAYSLTALLAVLFSSALSPVTIQGWHVLIALPAACIPIALWFDEIWPPDRAPLRWALILFLLLRLPEIVVLGYGHKAYRLDPDISSRLQERQRTLLPEDFRDGE